MSDPVFTQVVPPFKLTVSFDRAAWRYDVLIEHEADETKRAVDHVFCSHEPIFGIDVGDMSEIRAVAESLCLRLEHSP